MCAHTSMFLILHTPHLFHSKDSEVRFGENIQIHSQSLKYVKISKHSYENSYKNWKIYTIKPDKSNELLVLIFLIVTAPHSGQMNPSRSRLSARRESLLSGSIWNDLYVMPKPVEVKRAFFFDFSKQIIKF